MIGTGTTRPNFKLKQNDSFISIPLLNNIISSTTINKAVVEENISELWYETLHGYGKITFKNNITYEGSLKYGILNNEDPDTPCTLCFPDGTKYVGTIKNNRITGEGTYTFNNGATYKGTVVNGLRDGFGVYKSADNIYYEGGWKNGLKHGKGKIIQGGMELEGEWVAGILCGKCRIKWKSGNVFDGELKNNAMNGNGYMIWYNKNEKFIGQWKNNLQNGWGIHIWYDLNNDNKFFRNRYVGQWKDGKRNGYGIFFYNNGCVYEGYWKNNKKEGFGIYYYFDKTKYIGNFKDDIMIDRLTKEQINLLLKKNTNINQIPNDNVSKMTVSRKSTVRLTKTNLSENLKQSEANTKKATPAKEVTSNNNNEDEEKKTEKIFKDKKDRINKNLDGIKIPLYLSDLIDLEPDIKKFLKPLDNILLRNLSLITHVYLVACGKEDIKSSDIGMSTVINDQRSVFGKPNSTQKTTGQNNLDSKKSSNLEELQQWNPGVQNEEKKEKKIDYDNVYNNDCYFCLDFKCLWKLVRDCGLISPDFCLAQVNRIIFQNRDNYIDMFYIPMNYENNNKNKEEFENIYDYLFQKIIKAKNNFNNKYKSQIDQFSILTNGIVINEIETETYKPKNIFEDDFNYHEEKNIILLKYFYEILIRIAFAKFNDDQDMNIENRAKLLFDNMKTYFKSKKKSGSDLSTMMISFLDPKMRNPESTLDTFITSHYILLQNLFNDLYLYSCDNEKCIKTYDMTITYRYFYENIILKNESLSKVFENKMHYIDLITLFFKERKITSLNIDNIDIPPEELYIYIENVLDIEMIFREFCELVFFISRKYFIFYGISAEEEEPKTKNKVENEHKKEDKLKKKLKKKIKKDEDENNVGGDLEKDNKTQIALADTEEKPKNEDVYLKVINEIEKTKNELIINSKYEGINKYLYPTLKNHTIIAKLKEDERLRKLEEERKEKDRIRYTKERMVLKEEDINIYKEVDEEEKTDSEELSDF